MYTYDIYEDEKMESIMFFFLQNSDLDLEPDSVGTCLKMGAPDGYYFEDELCDSTTTFAPLCEKISPDSGKLC